MDAIVIGSGVGGLGLAVLLAKVGKKVLVLEQHSKAGGCCHTFSEKGFEFDVGESCLWRRSLQNVGASLCSNGRVASEPQGSITSGNSWNTSLSAA